MRVSLPGFRMIWLVACVYIIASACTFIAYGLDKRWAIRGQRRIPERTLHWFELLGGFPGAILGQAIFRHKRRKVSYMIVFVGIVAVHVAGWAIWYRRFRGG